jgi:predicted TPR repeat methyltransferase
MQHASVAPKPPALPDPAVLAAKAHSFLVSGRPGAAHPLVRALRFAGGDPQVSTALGARCLFAQGRRTEALALLDAEIDASKPSSALLFARAELRAQAADVLGAALDAADALLLAPDDTRAKTLLGRALLHLRRPADAVACLREALRAKPHDAQGYLDLVAALDAAGRPDEGEAVLAAALAIPLASPALHSAAILRRVRAGDLEAAVSIAAAARQRMCLEASGYELLGHALRGLGRQDDAADAYAHALKLAPENRSLRHLAAAAGRYRADDHAPPDYIRSLFGDYPGLSDDQRGRLGALVPDLARHVNARCADDVGAVLDLGCGAGPLPCACTPGPAWIGVDLSPHMLRRARATSHYTELHEADIPDYLQAETRRFSLVCACDVLPYFGPLIALFRAVGDRMAPGAQFIFTFERLAPGPDEVRLGVTGRYAHTAAHVAAAANAAGLSLALLEPASPCCDGALFGQTNLCIVECPA